MISPRNIDGPEQRTVSSAPGLGGDRVRRSSDTRISVRTPHAVARGPVARPITVMETTPAESWQCGSSQNVLEGVGLPVTPNPPTDIGRGGPASDQPLHCGHRKVLVEDPVEERGLALRPELGTGRRAVVESLKQ